MFDKLQHKAKELKKSIVTLSVALRHKRTPWYAKVVLLLVVSYALSPIDLIPDFIPVLGLLDDLLLLPLGIALGIKLIPEDVWQECQQTAESQSVSGRKNWFVGGLIILLWLILIVVLAKVFYGICFDNSVEKS
ncbi:YkvA family protein [Bacteroides sp. UBA939]|uniref:YkvA family protein n=1 Tax=Bacteroides sp. UBA939 TaxID=1946092 RepID=UPI0025C42F6A|nr:DUF1232 domain-containing protein [Bacteroides sp. UBA939]